MLIDTFLLFSAAETVCASVVPLMSFHILKPGSKVNAPLHAQPHRCLSNELLKYLFFAQAAEAAARESKMRSMAFNIFACTSRCSGVSFSSNLRLSLQAGLVHALLR
jgi:hypothetical protein